MQDKNARWIVGVTGASGIRYGLRLLEVLSECVFEVHAVFSESALRVMQDEENLKLAFSTLSAETLFGRTIPNIRFHNPRDIGAEIASGSALFDGMAVVPCSMATLGAVANGVPQNLVHRAAEVTLKEGRKLIMVPRETPLSAIHLENMLKLSRLGVTMLPAMPGFYTMPTTIAEIVDMLVMKILDQMKVPNEISRRWSGKRSAATLPGSNFENYEGH